jgi:hypothetical protein
LTFSDDFEISEKFKWAPANVGAKVAEYIKCTGNIRSATVCFDITTQAIPKIL